MRIIQEKNSAMILHGRLVKFAVGRRRIGRAVRNLRRTKVYLDYMCPRYVCRNGVSLSIQASASHYCNPRETLNVTPWVYYTSVEVGYIQGAALPESFMPYYDGMGVFAYVPTKLVIDFVKENEQ